MTDITLNQKADGYRGIWYMNQPSNDEYVYKYSGGMGTYCAKHRPFAVYRPEVNMTFFCYGGSSEQAFNRCKQAIATGDATDNWDPTGLLLHMVSYFDHETKQLPRPTILMDKMTGDAHDNPVISMDEAGYIWIFSTSHGVSRPSYIHRSKQPYDIDEFELIDATYIDEQGSTQPVNNYSYMQAWHRAGKGFACFFTKYNWPAKRSMAFMTSEDGKTWSRWQRLAAIEEGHYQISAASKDRMGTAFNMHPHVEVGNGLNWRTNLYYMQTDDDGSTWQNAQGERLELPLMEIENKALVHDYAAEGLKVYLKDITFDEQNQPVIVYVTSKGYESGPENGPRTWTIAHWTGSHWNIREAMQSDSNYDTGSIYLESPTCWRLIAPTAQGPQPYNPGGEMELWESTDQGATWTKLKTITRNSERNHTYARRPVDAHPDFAAIWADGNAREPSDSRLYIADRDGNCFELPSKMTQDFHTLTSST